MPIRTTVSAHVPTGSLSSQIASKPRLHFQPTEIGTLAGCAQATNTYGVPEVQKERAGVAPQLPPPSGGRPGENARRWSTTQRLCSSQRAELTSHRIPLIGAPWSMQASHTLARRSAMRVSLLALLVCSFLLIPAAATAQCDEACIEVIGQDGDPWGQGCISGPDGYGFDCHATVSTCDIRYCYFAMMLLDGGGVPGVLVQGCPLTGVRLRRLVGRAEIHRRHRGSGSPERGATGEGFCVG